MKKYAKLIYSWIPEQFRTESMNKEFVVDFIDIEAAKCACKVFLL